MTIRIDDVHQLNFADLHFTELKKSISKEIYGKEVDFNDEEMLAKLKSRTNAAMFKLLTSKGSFKLTLNQCTKVKSVLDTIQIHRRTQESEYNQLMKMLKDFITTAIEMKLGVEFI